VVREIMMSPRLTVHPQRYLAVSVVIPTEFGVVLSPDSASLDLGLFGPPVFGTEEAQGVPLSNERLEKSLNCCSPCWPVEIALSDENEVHGVRGRWDRVVILRGSSEGQPVHPEPLSSMMPDDPPAVVLNVLLVGSKDEIEIEPVHILNEVAKGVRVLDRPPAPRDP